MRSVLMILKTSIQSERRMATGSTESIEEYVLPRSRVTSISLMIPESLKKVKNLVFLTWYQMRSFRASSCFSIAQRQAQ